MIISDSDRGERMSEPLKVFITYAHKNKEAKDNLIECLAVIKNEGLISIWHDNEILPGDKWRDEIFSTHLPDSDILLYLVSRVSLASENCNKELAGALNFKIRVIPIILESCEWQNHQLSDFQALPDGVVPINQWDHEDDGWQNVVEGIREVVEEMQTQSDLSPDTSERELRTELAFQQGNVFMMLGQIDRAIEAYSHAITLDPNNVDAYYNRGVAYNNKGDSERAIVDFTKVIRMNPNFAQAYYNRGIAYERKGDYTRAIEDFTKAMEMNPGFVKAYYNRGVTYNNKGDFDRAIAACTTVIKMNPNFTIAYINRGAAYGEKGDFDHAIEDFNKAIELKPDFAIAYANRGSAYQRKGDYDRAIEDCTKAMELNPNYAEAYYNRGVAYGKKGDFDHAIVDYTKAIDLKPDFAEAYNNRGAAYGEKSDFDCAIADYTKAIDLKPDFAEAYYNRGEARLRLTEWEKAKSDLTAARDMGINIIAAFRNDYGSVEGFEQIIGVQLSADLAAMLTPQIIAMRKEASGEATHESVSDAEIDLDEIIRNYDRAWKTLAKP